MSKNTKKNQVVNFNRFQVVSRISTDASGKVTGKWNGGQTVVNVGGNVWKTEAN